MRDLIFRGKKLTDGEWLISDSIIQRANGTVGLYDEVSNDVVDVDPATVGQFTGLTDKNCVNVFEGDIVIFNRGRNLPNTIPRPLKVFFDEMNAQFTCYPSPYATLKKEQIRECEIIGNIYDNGDLL